jgi:hypothetical protein
LDRSREQNSRRADSDPKSAREGLKAPEQLSKGDWPRPALPQVGRPPDYDIPKLEATAVHYIATYGLPDSVAKLIEKVRDELGGSSVPEKTQAYEIFGPIWRKAKAEQGGS